MKKVIAILSLVVLASCMGGGETQLAAVIIPPSTFVPKFPAQFAVSKKADEIAKTAPGNFIEMEAEWSTFNEFQLANSENFKNLAKQLSRARARYYSEMYKGYKVISSDALEDIVVSHHLSFNNFSNYTGFIPEDKLNTILNFRPLQKYAIWQQLPGKPDYTLRHLVEAKIADKDVRDRLESGADGWNIERDNVFEGDAYAVSQDHWIHQSILKKFNYKDNLFIVADSSVVLNNKVDMKDKFEGPIPVPQRDPIVFLKLIDCYLVIAAWGDEEKILKKY